MAPFDWENSDYDGPEIRRFTIQDHDRGVLREVVERPMPSGGCFIATAAYGTPFNEEVNILRYWRDHFLMKHSLGEKFVDFYYKTSPPIADFIRSKKSIKVMIRFILKPFVELLKNIYRKKD